VLDALPGPGTAALIAAIGYLLGSIPFGLIFSFAFGAGDVRKIGSGNIGATNVLRTGNKAAALLTLLFDAGKGAVAVLLARHWFSEAAVVLVAACVVVGHLFPPWLKFKGGKGVATSAGILLALYWPAGLIVGATWIATAAVTRFSSLAALLGALIAPIAMFFLSIPLHALLALFLCVTIFLTHKANIERLRNGTESRIGVKKKPA
jgi:glycerol-3-phosphate acyltransferase PlsY